MEPTREMDRFLAVVTRLPRKAKRVGALVADVVVLATVFSIANILIAKTSLPRELGWLCVAAPATAVPVFAKLGLYRAVIRFISLEAIASVTAGVSISVVILAVIDRAVPPPNVPVAALAMYWSFALLYVAGSRFMARALLGGARRGGIAVAIYGAGEAGALLSSTLRQGNDYNPVAFVDDDPALAGSSIAGIAVYPASALPTLISGRTVAEILLAIPSASHRRRREILAGLEGLGVRVRSMPDLADIVAGRARVGELRDVIVTELLGREVVAPIDRLLRGSIEGKAVLVTGAGGSIGSELCRRIIELSPGRLVLVEQSEVALYTIDRELRAALASLPNSVEITPLLGNAGDGGRMNELFATFRIDTVYHAAAYKHVPIVEQNIVEGVRNNALATWRLSEAAISAGVETFVLVSTDKAVNPTNVMGATKRVAELVVQAAQQRGAMTRFAIVRFGNVLESSGSVVPLFREQIARGGPITVTHPDVIRYFMTIQEASALVIQASSLAKGGDVFLLDMGEPVRIDELARRMVRLSGLTIRDCQHPDGDIEVHYTGLRPAEKLSEELLVSPTAERTEHARILRAFEQPVPWESLRRKLVELEEAVACGSARHARELLATIVCEYTPSPGAEDLVQRASSAAVSLNARPG